ncbi:MULTISPECIES: Tc toxin subunit A-related protein [Photorhabdus]|uniref:Tc toxin subunit A-related protein n=1 Tax=Photorhabdus TaxID=29487 RepID=UPI000DCB1BB0|nr:MULTISPECIES: neuraminidase-like domain-containing protein [Photorhabdus]MCT8342099.1 Tc toxin subunit A [Photorhabdus kleinii]RAX01173.1 toxin [Photorhabdus sp. S9-53]RAX01602.1 toxin [Photorhabdus sp. S10-54]RAX05017.1 toxin [Photorhabdus sp. S8-52]
MNTLKSEYQQALGAGFNNLTDICHLSFDELRKKVKDQLSWSQTQSLYLEAQQVQKDNLLHEARILKRANPQLQSAVHLALTTPHADQQGYNSRFGNRASQYAAPGAISSMFSPAAYLAELYRQARNLHDKDSIYHLDKRRPDLKSLVLSQKNMDTEISTLSLSNDMLLEGIKTQPNLDSHTKVMEKLSTFRLSSSMPYHDAYESVRKVIQLQAQVFEQLSVYPETTLSQLKYQASLLDINASVSPKLFTILTEEITESTAETLYKNNFGDIKPSLIEKLEYLKSYYNLSDEEFSDFLKIRTILLPEEEITITEPASRTTSTQQTIEKTNYRALLKINKFIRLFKAINLSPTVLSGILHSISPEFNINEEVLKKIFCIKYYMQRYGIDAETALILCKAPISQHSNDGHPSQFDRLFNSPKLNGQDFSTNGTPEIDLNLSSTNSWHKTVLKRAFNVDDISLNRLLKVTYGDNTKETMVNNRDNLSHLYRTKLLADIHQLTIDELGVLLVVVAIDEGKTDLSKITHDNLAVLISKLYTVTNWLRTRKWSVYQLFVMTTTDYNQTLTPEIQNLLDTIYNGLQDFDKKILKAKEELKKAEESQQKSEENLNKAKKNLQEAEENLKKTLSHYIAAALQLPSENVALSVLAWADKLNYGKADKMTADTLWDWLRKNPFGTQSSEPTGTTASDNSIQQAVHYCQCLAQLALIYRSTGLSESTLRLFVTNPQLFGLTTTATSTHNVLSLIMLTRFTDWVNSLGENASSVLTEFEKGTLTAEILAKAMNLDENLLEQAKTQAKADFSNWSSIDTIRQWINIARQLNISPQGISELEQVLDIESSADYTKWENVASILTSGLDTQKANALHAFLDESRSAALSTYYIYSHNQKDRKERKHTVIKDRDDLYQYLLIDNQVSAAIKTTEIAEAIASIQLYINRALKNMEEDTDTSVTSRSFFTNWDKYNKRYSTWAGIAKLLYYPENYIDPTLRIGQTKMMDALLQSISQSQLNTDTVEDAFKSYLTSFEQVANLEVISAYHDNINNDQGLTYFIGRSKTEVNQYYWRSVDHNKFSEGKFPANAWSEWHKIDCPINPYEDTIRPVIYQSRLYITWLEQKKVTNRSEVEALSKVEALSEIKTDKQRSKTTTSYYYELKLAHIRYDGTWNTPITFDVDKKISDLNLEPNKVLGLYCASYQGKDKLLVIFYQKRPEQADYRQATMQGLYISSNMSQEEMKPNDYKLNIHEQLDTRTETNSVIRVNNRYAESYEIPSSVNSNNGYDWGEGYLSMVYGGSILITRPQLNGSKIQISPKLRIIHNGYEGRQRNQCNLMKKYGKLGDKFIIYTTLGINQNNLSNKKFIYPVYQYGDTPEKGKLLFYRDSATNFVRAWLPNLPSGSQEMSVTTGGNISGNYGYIDNKHSNNNPFKEYFYMDDHGGIDTDVSGPMFINTDIKSSNVKVIIKATGIKEETFIASKDNNVPTEPPPNFEEMYYQFKALKEIDVSKLTYNNNEASIDVTFTASAEAFESGQKERNLGEEHFSIRITKKAETDNVLSLHSNPSGAQYMQWGNNSTRLNTLFARKLISRANAGIDTILSMETQNIQEPKLGEDSLDATEPMDFNGANSLYFWELFYYTPMLIAQRLLHEQNFDEANRWLKYVWNPAGYIVNGQMQHYRWNVRPLQEDTSWNDDPLDSVDPDAVAQHDPMHYKVATFMRTLDLLIEQGDYAYRQLERDTLAEAKMWYMQALHLLGDKPHLPLSSTWNDPELEEAADLEKQQIHAKAIADLRQGQSTDGGNTDLFLPQVNEVMLSYWQKLEQRLYNLRHNLSIDGQPLHLPIFATPADPKALLSAAVASSQGGSNMPTSFMSLWRFPHMLENARGMVSQLTQFGSTLQNIIERQDAEALNTLLQNHAAELVLTNLSIQGKTIEELDVEKTVLEKTRAGAQSRFDSYSKFYNEDINAGEKQAMALRASVAGISTALQASHLAGAALDLAPNIFGFADGGSHWGAIAQATGNVMEFSASVMNTEADKISQSEAYRRRRQEWEIQRNNAETELKQIDAQLQSLVVRREAAVLQKTSLKTQQEQTQAQLLFLQHKFSNQALYNWLRGRLSAIYFQFYDLTVARCLMAEMAYRWETNDTTASFIKPGAWQGTHAGLLAGETLMLNLAQMEDAHLKQDQRVLEVERTVSLANIYKEKSQFSLTEKIAELVKNKLGTAGSGNNALKFGTKSAKTSLQASISLADLQICHDYPEGSGVGNVRRIKQISVTLPALLGPYQDVQAILSYSGDVTGLTESCKSLAVSHGMNDSGQFQLDFNDGKFLPFEGIDIDKGTLTLSFPNAIGEGSKEGKQQTMLESLSDIILHIRYTIRQ